MTPMTKNIWRGELTSKMDDLGFLTFKFVLNAHFYVFLVFEIFSMQKMHGVQWEILSWELSSSLYSSFFYLSSADFTGFTIG